MFGKSIKKLIVSLVVAVFFGAQIFPLCPVNANAQSVLVLPATGEMIQTSSAFNPALIQGITLYPENPLKFDFIIDKGDEYFEGDEFRDEASKLINYFMASLTVPEDEMWVNLSPYEQDRIIAEGLIQTELGRDMLAQDYLLKQITASFMHPDGSVGAKFWEKIYARAQELYGTTEMPVNTFNKVWIVPEEAVVYVNGTSAFVVESHLKVMLEGDYLALDNNSFSEERGTDLLAKSDVEQISDASSAIVRDVIIPELEREVNEGENFANLRQMFNSMILATWYKQNLRNSIFGEAYIDQNKVSGIDLAERGVKEQIYGQYVEAFKKGVYDFVREEYDDYSQAIIPRKYFSGGIVGQKSVKDTAMLDNGDKADSLLDGEKERVTVEIKGGDRNSMEQGNRISDMVTGESSSEDPVLIKGTIDKIQYSLEFFNKQTKKTVPNFITVNARKDQKNVKVEVNLRRILKEKFENFLSRPDHIQKVLGDIDSDVFFSDIRRIDVEFIRISERVVFNLKIYTDESDTEPKEEVIAKVIRKKQNFQEGENEFEFKDVKDLQSEAFEALKYKGARFVPRYTKAVQGIYYEEKIEGKSILQYALERGKAEAEEKQRSEIEAKLTSEEIEEIAYSWLTIWRHVKDSPNITTDDSKVLDLNPGNIMVRDGGGLLDSFVVIDIFRPKSGSYTTKDLVRDLLKFYVSGTNPGTTVKSEKFKDIEPVFEGIYRALDYDRDQTIAFLKSILQHGVVDMKEWTGTGEDLRISDYELYTAIEKYLGEELDHKVESSFVVRYNNRRNVRRNRINANNASNVNQGESLLGRTSEEPKENPGGIDLDSNNLDLRVEGDRFDFEFSEDFEGIDIDAQGFQPIIINISPVMNMPMLLGIADKEENQPQLTYSLN